MDKLATADQTFRKRLAEMELTCSVVKLENRELLPEGNHRIVIANIVVKSNFDLKPIRTEVYVEASQEAVRIGRRYDLMFTNDHFGYGAIRARLVGCTGTQHVDLLGAYDHDTAFPSAGVLETDRLSYSGCPLGATAEHWRMRHSGHVPLWVVPAWPNDVLDWSLAHQR